MLQALENVGPIFRTNRRDAIRAEGLLRPRGARGRCNILGICVRNLLSKATSVVTIVILWSATPRSRGDFIKRSEARRRTAQHVI